MPKSESTFPFQYITIVETWQSFETPAPLLEEIDMCVLCLYNVRQGFFKEFYSQQFLFEAFSDLIRIFDSVQP